MALGYCKYLTGISLVGDENVQKADKQSAYVQYTSKMLVKTYLNVIAIIGYNTSTNKSFARMPRAIFVEHQNLCFNLAVENIFWNLLSCRGKRQ